MNNLWKEWFNYVLYESLRQWNDFADDRKDYTLEDFVKFTKEIALSQPPAGQWIPCSEGTLPANGRTVPVTNEVSQGKRYMTTATYYTKKGVVDDYEWTGEGFYQYDSEYGYGRLHNVVAWLNVEPYKGGVE
jgi:hypothetical protein